MSFWDKLEKLVDTGIALNSIYEANKWIELKATELQSKNTNVSAQVDIAYHIGYMDNETWKKFSAGLALKVLSNKKFAEMKNYCDFVVALEVGKYKHLTSLPIGEGMEILGHVLNTAPMYEKCAYIGLLMAKSQNDIKANQLYHYSQKLLTHGLHSPSPPMLNATYSNASPSGKILEFKLVLDVQSDQNFGLEIHTKFSIEDSINKDCELTAWFEFSNGQELKDLNNKYGSVDGNVATFKRFSPPYQSSLYENMTLFLPYDELHLKKEGSHSIRFQVGLFCNGTQLDKSEYLQFSIRYN